MTRPPIASSDFGSRLSRVPHAIGRTLRLPPREMLTTLRVVVTIGVVEVLIRSIRLPRLSRVLGCPVDLTPVQPDVEHLAISELPAAPRRQVRCTIRVARVWPFADGPCLRRTLVSGHLLRDLGPTIRLGVGRAGDTISAHAWLEIDGRPLELVSGYEPFQHRPQVAK